MVAPKVLILLLALAKQAQPQAQTARSLSTLRVSERPFQALTPGPFRFLGFLHEPCVRCCGFTRHSCCGNSDATVAAAARVSKKTQNSEEVTQVQHINKNLW